METQVSKIVGEAAICQAKVNSQGIFKSITNSFKKKFKQNLEGVEVECHLLYYLPFPK
jgi:hypothetical protein